ncbi:MAG TPA: carbonic anhydrase [Actinomycetes bacterium]|nr:carbonic anhydrase [Actinomycetes bacterium]
MPDDTHRRDADAFADLRDANEVYAADFALGGLEPRAARGLAVLTCMDSRIEPLTALGLLPGDAKIVRNAGARVTEDVLRTLVLAVHLLGVERILVMPHTRCRMAGQAENDVHAAIDTATGLDTRSLEFRTVSDQLAALDTDLQRIRSWPWIPDDVPVAGAVYDVDTGRLGPLRSPGPDRH